MHWLQQAEDGFDQGEMKLRAAVTRRRRGELTPGDEGRDLLDAADRWMREQGFASPARVAGAFAPGRWTRR